MRESESRYRTMADKVIERSRQFEEMNKQLASLNKELETFSYSVSHDLRSPLRANLAPKNWDIIFSDHVMPQSIAHPGKEPHSY